jgi:hypothetical protein
MAAAKMETAAERYRRIKAERLAQEELVDVETPSGMTWKLRRPNLAQFVTSGIMPISLAGKLAEADKDGNPAEAFNALDWEEKARTIEFSAKVVRYCAVDPKIVENPKGPNEISPDEVELDDFNYIFGWAMSGGGEADNLGTFRRQQ